MSDGVRRKNLRGDRIADVTAYAAMLTMRREEEGAAGQEHLDRLPCERKSKSRSKSKSKSKSKTKSQIQSQRKSKRERKRESTGKSQRQSKSESMGKSKSTSRSKSKSKRERIGVTAPFDSASAPFGGGNFATPQPPWLEYCCQFVCYPPVPCQRV